MAMTACPNPELPCHGQAVFADDPLPMRLDFLNSCPPGNWRNWDVGDQPMKVEAMFDDCQRDFASYVFKIGCAKGHWEYGSEVWGSHCEGKQSLSQLVGFSVSSLGTSKVDLEIDIRDANGALKKPLLDAQPCFAAQPIVISRAQDKDIIRVEWIVDARKIKGTDKVVVSPPFEMPSVSSAVFKMMITPKSVVEGKGGASFKKSKGKGTVQLKCESRLDDEASMVFQIRIGHHETNVSSVCREEWNFADAPLYQCQQDWDFTKFVDVAKRSFSVIIEVGP